MNFLYGTYSIDVGASDRKGPIAITRAISVRNLQFLKYDIKMVKLKVHKFYTNIDIRI